MFGKIKRLIKWIPILWNTYDFDYGSAIDVFRFQLSRIADYLESSKARTSSAKQSAQRIRTTIKLMEKVYDDEYSMEWIKKKEGLYGKSKFVFKKCEYENYYEMVLEYEKNYSDGELLKIEKHTDTLRAESEAKQEKAERILWKLIRTNIRNWWD